GVDGVVVASAVEHELVCRLRVDDSHRSGGTGDRYGTIADRADADPVISGGGVDSLRSLRAVPQYRAERGCEYDLHDDSCLAGSAEVNVVPLVSVDESVAVAAEHNVGAVAAANGVVAGTAVHRQADQGGQVARGAEGVVAAVHVDHEVLGGADIEAERRGRDA